MEEKDLLRITKEDQGLGVHWNVHGSEEMFGVCVSIANCLKHNEAFMLMLLGVVKELFSDSEFSEAVDKNCVEMPDFDSILKSQDNE